jgi:hypothetical protein
VSQANRRKRLWNEIKKRRFTDLQGQDNVILQTPRDWLKLHTGLPADMADAFVRELRRHGGYIWLYPDRTDNTVRTRIMLPSEVFSNDEDEDAEIMQVLAYYARDIAHAVERTGQWNPPPDNPWNDTPLPAGGTWWWG